MALRKLRGEEKGLQDVSLLKIREVAEKIVSGASSTECFDNHPHGHAHSPNARFATHDFGVDCNPLEVPHNSSLALSIAV